MGFYSFYKIIKDMIRTIFGNTFLKIVLIIIIIMLIFGSLSSCFAASYNLNGSTVMTNSNIDELFDYSLIVFTDNDYLSYYYVFYSDYPIYLDSSGVTGNGHTIFFYGFSELNSRMPSTFDYSNIQLDSYTECGYTTLPYFKGAQSIVYSNHDIKDLSGNLVFPSSEGSVEKSKPYFLNSDEELMSGQFDELKIIDKEWLERFYLHVARIDNPSVSDLDVKYYLDEKVFVLDRDSSYLYIDPSNSFCEYYIPKSKLGFSLENDREYIFVLSSSPGSLSTLSENDIYVKKQFIVSARTDESVIKDKQDEQIDAIKENTETNKRYLGNHKRITKLY